jgi:hypothetical protein
MSERHDDEEELECWPVGHVAQLREALRGFTEAVENSPHGECFDRKSPTYLRARAALGDTSDE